MDFKRSIANLQNQLKEFQTRNEEHSYRHKSFKTFNEKSFRLQFETHLTQLSHQITKISVLLKPPLNEKALCELLTNQEILMIQFMTNLFSFPSESKTLKDIHQSRIRVFLNTYYHYYSLLEQIEQPDVMDVSLLQQILRATGILWEQLETIKNLDLNLKKCCKSFISFLESLLDDIEEELISLPVNDVLPSIENMSLKATDDQIEESSDDLFAKLFQEEKPLTQKEQIITKKVLELFRLLTILLKKIKLRTIESCQAYHLPDIEWMDQLLILMKQLEVKMDDLGASCHAPQSDVLKNAGEMLRQIEFIISFSRERAGAEHDLWFDTYKKKFQDSFDQLLDYFPSR